MTFTIHRNEVPIEVEIEFSYYPASRGIRNYCGAPITPDEGATAELESCTCDGISIELTDKELEKAQEQYLIEL